MDDGCPNQKSQETNPQKCATFDEALGLAGFGLFNYLLTLTCGLILTASVIEILSITYVIAVAECDLQLSTEEKGILCAVVFAGIIMSSHLWGFLADTRGRRKVIIGTLCSAFTSTLLSSFMASFWLIALFRFLTGFFISGASAPVYAYLGEFHCNKHRSRAIMGASFVVGVGCLLLPIIAFLVINQNWVYTLPLLKLQYQPWRLFLIVCGLPGIVGALAMLWFPESPKFMFDQGNKQQAIETIQWMHRKNKSKRGDALRVEVIAEADTVAHRDEGTTTQLDVSNGVNFLIKKIWNQTAPLFKSPYLAKTALVCVLQFATYVTAYGMYMFFPAILNQLVEAQEAGASNITLCQIVSTRTDDSLVSGHNQSDCNRSLAEATYGYSFLLDFMVMVGIAIIGLIIGFVGRLAILVFFLTVSGIAGILVVFVSVPLVSMWLYMVLLLTYCVLGVVNAVAVDLFPTKLRAMAVSISIMCGQLGSVIGTNMNGLLLDSYCEMSFGISAALLLLCSVLSFFIPNNPGGDKEESTP